jgi:hypothetical protein
VEDTPTELDEVSGRGAPSAPSADVRQELVALLEADGSRLGEVYRAQQRALSAAQIAEELGVASRGFVYNYSAMAKALLDGEVPSSPSFALQAARRFRAILKSRRLSPDTRLYLTDKLGELELRANDVVARVEETQRAQEQTAEAEARNEVGIYVYALPHYLRYPFDSDSGRTLMKVGRSDSDVIVRFRNQTRTTALPEEPILLRVYPTAAGTDFEARFHRLLEAADHHRSVARTAGREWFVTSTRFLDEAARVMGLNVMIVNEAPVDED